MSSNFCAPPDPNLYVPETVDSDGARFYNVRSAPFDVYGLYDYKNEPQFKRLPDEIGVNTNSGVAQLYTNTAGGRIRFCTDSKYVILRAAMPKVTHFPHMPLTGTGGFDLYIDDPKTNGSTFWRSFKPSSNMTDGYESKVEFKTSELRYFTVHFPCYNDVTSVHIGIADGASVGGGLPYRDLPPVVFYGSSITQGGCASRPGNAYTNNISRILSVDHINLGFSGNGKAEVLICEYMATLEMSVFVSDYDHNAPNAQYLADTHYRMYEIIRAKNPSLPYIMVSRPDYYGHDDSEARRRVIIASYERARASGDKNVYFVDGSKFFDCPYGDNCTVDGTHPNDLGFMKMTEHIGRAVAQALGLEFNA